MNCPECNGGPVRVIDSRPSKDYVRRRRRCAACGHRMTTYEMRVPNGRRVVLEVDNSGCVVRKDELLQVWARAEDVG